jgi:hypothetical protein
MLAAIALFAQAALSTAPERSPATLCISERVEYLSIGPDSAEAVGRAAVANCRQVIKDTAPTDLARDPAFLRKLEATMAESAANLVVAYRARAAWRNVTPPSQSTGSPPPGQ